MAAPRQIVVMSNCQTGGLHASLAAMLPDDVITPIAWLGTEPEYLRAVLGFADVWVSSLPRAQSEALAAEVGCRAEIIPIPTIWFPGFHPDLIHVPLPGGGELESAIGPYHSAIVVWGWQHGWSVEEILGHFTVATFDALGYLHAWGTAVGQVRTIVEEAEMDFATWFLPLVGRGPFMLTDNHPRVDALIQLARPIAAHLGADPGLVRFGWEQVLTDGLQTTSVVWPVYPGVAEALGFPGAFVWRAVDGSLLGLREFVEGSLARYAEIDPTSVSVARFAADPRCAAALGGTVLGRATAAAGA